MILNLIGRLLNPKADLARLKKKPAAQRGRLRASQVWLNGPLLLGSAIVLGLFMVVLFGPIIAPENPYLTGQRSLTYQDGELTAPPFPPSETFVLGTDQWGRDLLSLLLYGARNTLVAGVFIALVRLILGLALGATAGWYEDRLTDRVIMGIISLTTALPMLISGMILIHAFDIRRGLPTFMVALSLLGWGEIAQFIRGEFIVLRRAAFIEGARAVGVEEVAIAVRHILPNILPQVLIIALLEMSAVLMILGELGFVGVYIGGGTSTTSATDAVITIPDVPEWGAMMADSRLWARSKPWMVFYPALAFFIAVVGFNTLGEGLRRLLEQAAVSTAFLLRKEMVVIIAVITLATVYVINHVGPAPTYARLAQAFAGEMAYERLETLVSFAGRGNGQPGSQAAAEFIAGQFATSGLQPAGLAGTYFQPIETVFVQPQAQPRLSLLDATGRPSERFRYQLDFGFVSEGHGGGGEVRAPLAFVGFRPGLTNPPWEVYQGLDLRGRIVVLLSENAPPDFATEALIRGARGVLWVVSDDLEAIQSQTQLVGERHNSLRLPTLPIFRVRPVVAEKLLAAEGLDLDGLRRVVIDWPDFDRAWLVRELAATVEMSLQLGQPEPGTIVNVLGYLPGKDMALDDELVLVAAHYDGLGRDPDGTLYPAANSDASGVAVMLEVARLWHERVFEPRRTIVFAAWGGGASNPSGAEAYFDGYLGGLSLLQPVGIFQLDNLGAGGEALRLSGGPDRLVELVSRSAAQVGLTVRQEAGVYQRYQAVVQRRGPALLISWADAAVSPPQDRLERIDREKLRLAGEAINLALITIAREAHY